MPLTISFLFPCFYLDQPCHFFPLPLEENSHTPIVIEATTPVGVDEKLGETSFIRVSRFNSRRAVRDIRESSLIVFNRDTVCTWGERKEEKHACTSRGGENIYRGGQGGAAGGAQPCVFPIN